MNFSSPSVDNKVAQAGCVDPGLSHHVMTHVNTLFCSNEKLGYPYGCFDIKKNYSSVLGCYECLNCDKPEMLTSAHKMTCSGELPACFTHLITTDKIVTRGCVSNKNLSPCKSYSTCYLCQTNYCNGNRYIWNDLKCYTSKPFGFDRHSTTLQLESCSGRYPITREDKCYMAIHKRTMAITAGCVEDAPRDLVLYEPWISGKTNIIFEGVRSVCYKCKSHNREHCFNVSRLKPEACTGSGQYAVRGCYTYFSRFERYTIERGCMSELHPYLQGLCLLPHFEELCITCREPSCNTHKPVNKN